jgi:DNA-binding CsgD family transcriptional regulator
MGDGVLVVAADRHPLLARQRRYYRVPALVRRLPGGHLPGPGDPDPLAPFRVRRAADPLPEAALVVPELAGDEVPTSAGVTAGPGAAVATGAVPTAPARAQLVPAAAAPPRATDAPAALSCWAAPGSAEAPPPRPTDTGPGAPVPHVPLGGLSAEPSGVAPPAPPRLSATQRAVLDALADCGRPTAAISSAALAARTGINRSTVRAALRELRGKLGIDQGGDLVAAARAAGLLGPRPPSL